jgi:hypothetical protein
MARGSSSKKQKSANKHSKLSTMRSRLTLKHRVSPVLCKLNTTEEDAPDEGRTVGEEHVRHVKMENIEETYP